VSQGSVGRMVLVVVTAVIAQETLVMDVNVGGIHPDILVLFPIVAGIVGGPNRGVTVGFATGLVSDLFLPTPFGLSALVASIIGFAVGTVTVPLDRTAWWLPPAAGLIGSAVYEVVYAALGTVLGQPQMWHVDITRIVLVVGITNAVLALPARRVLAWALPAASTDGLPTSAGAPGPLW
jgi:rod shape-determining protein MreD